MRERITLSGAALPLIAAFRSTKYVRATERSTPGTGVRNRSTYAH